MIFIGGVVMWKFVLGGALLLAAGGVFVVHQFNKEQQSLAAFALIAKADHAAPTPTRIVLAKSIRTCLPNDKLTASTETLLPILFVTLADVVTKDPRSKGRKERLMSAFMANAGTQIAKTSKQEFEALVAAAQELQTGTTRDCVLKHSTAALEA
ncbi:hypothetical protein J2T09_003579 [Neorhizobium huautlense]|uniref:Co-chaperone DjlA N-terminal domain-containing protein n=1 Tax=Neorhizobium huautlense TaxID=67774 RepID=A0ABT9PWL9_9HYPH|nr:hypothetical protein [Neorhizobium huautlense]MDP9838807.1 hypothetical protein [Neorhizobium huautlense]